MRGERNPDMKRFIFKLLRLFLTVMRIQNIYPAQPYGPMRYIICSSAHPNRSVSLGSTTVYAKPLIMAIMSLPLQPPPPSSSSQLSLIQEYHFQSHYLLLLGSCGRQKHSKRSFSAVRFPQQRRNPIKEIETSIDLTNPFSPILD